MMIDLFVARVNTIRDAKTVDNVAKAMQSYPSLNSRIF